MSRNLWTYFPTSRFLTIFFIGTDIHPRSRGKPLGGKCSAGITNRRAIMMVNPNYSQAIHMPILQSTCDR
jgi:hypothetical protein